MAFELKMPKLGESVTEGTIGKWLKQPGDKVNKYDLLVEVQTDKVNTEIPSPVAGTLKEVKVEEGQTVPIGTLLAVFETADGEAAASAPQPAPDQPATQPQPGAAQPPKPSQPGGSQAPTGPGAPAGRGPSAVEPPRQPQARSAQRAAPPPPQSASPASQSSAAATATAERPDLSDVRATPAVRKLAGENGIDISQIEGTGLAGRVSRKDVEDFIAQRQSSQQQAAARVVPAQPQAPSQTAPARQAPVPSLAGDELVPLSQMRRAIANNMVQAWSAPHAHAVMEVDMTELMRYRDRVKHEFQEREGFDLSPAAFIAKAVVEALRTVPSVNSSWTDQGLIRHRELNLGYAVALGEDGLIVPVIKDDDGKSLAVRMRYIRVGIY